ncbi:MAG TPA: T9SS type A sorting domain-containing protein [Chitinophagales bacterium]|nr:T9SS type A sorting domain-containing protein [Chitinophagales bacterium]
MKRQVYLSILLLSFISLANAQPVYQWAKSIGGNGYDAGSTIQSDPPGNIYIAGDFQDTVDFDPGPGAADLIGADGSNQSFFIAKYDNSGNYLWAFGIGNTPYAVCSSFRLDHEGNVFATGYFSNKVDFDPGPDTNALNAGSSIDIFIAKYNANGEYVWAKRIGSYLNDYSNSIQLDDASNIYITGSYSDTVDFEPGAGTAFLYPEGFGNGAGDIFIASYDSSGHYIWAKGVGGNDGGDEGYYVCLDDSDNVYAGGIFIGTVDFDPGAGIDNHTASPFYYGSIFFTKYDASGNFKWAKTLGGNGGENLHCMQVKSSGDSTNIYLSGDIYFTTDFDPGPDTADLSSGSNFSNTIFIAKYSGNGNYMWAKGIQSVGYYGYSGYNSIQVDSFENIYLAGTCKETFDFDPGIGSTILSSPGLYQFYIAKYNSSGDVLWATEDGAKGYQLYHNSVCLDAANNLYVTSGFAGSADLDPGIDSAIFVGTGSISDPPDIFFAKYSTAIPTENAGTDQNKNGIKIFPNPASDNCKITYSIEATARLTFTDAYGRVVKQLILYPDLHNQVVDVDDLPTGIFIVRLQSGNHFWSQKMVKE